MPRQILVTGGPAGSLHFVERLADDEEELQGVLLANPELLPAQDLGLDGTLLVVGRETGVASGRIDLVCLSKTGELAIVEFKTGPQNSDFRHALAQVIDYGSDLWKLGNWTSFDQGVVHRYLNGPHVQADYKACANLREAAAKAWNLTDEEWELLINRLDVVLSQGDFRFVVAAQRFTPSMKTSISYLNHAAATGKYFLVELIRLDSQGQKAYAAQVVHKPEARTATPSGGSSKASTEAFLAAIADSTHQEAMEELFATVEVLGLTLAWGSKGASIRLRSPDQAEPISIGWVFNGDDGWNFAKHVTFGVDLTTLPRHPTCGPAIVAYCDQVAALPGGKPAAGKSKATIFLPSEFPKVRAQIFELLSQLTEHVAQQA